MVQIALVEVHQEGIQGLMPVGRLQGEIMELKANHLHEMAMMEGKYLLLFFL